MDAVLRNACDCSWDALNTLVRREDKDTALRMLEFLRGDIWQFPFDLQRTRDNALSLTLNGFYNMSAVMTRAVSMGRYTVDDAVFFIGLRNNIEDIMNKLLDIEDTLGLTEAERESYDGVLSWLAFGGETRMMNVLSRELARAFGLDEHSL